MLQVLRRTGNYALPVVGKLGSPEMMMYGTAGAIVGRLREVKKMGMTGLLNGV